MENLFFFLFQMLFNPKFYSFWEMRENFEFYSDFIRFWDFPYQFSNFKDLLEVFQSRLYIFLDFPHLLKKKRLNRIKKNKQMAIFV